MVRSLSGSKSAIDGSNIHEPGPCLDNIPASYPSGVKKIRFEMPYNVWCLGCKVHIGMGVRYNAEKTKVAKYYSTDIYQFRMRCHLCGNTIEIRTDPKRFDYEIIKGLVRRDSTISDSPDQVEDLESDPMYKLERKLEDQQKNERQMPILQRLIDWRSSLEDNFTCNKLARSHFRERRKAIERERKQERSLQRKTSLRIPLIAEDPEIKEEALSLYKEAIASRSTKDQRTQTANSKRLKSKRKEQDC